MVSYSQHTHAAASTRRAAQKARRSKGETRDLDAELGDDLREDVAKPCLAPTLASALVPAPAPNNQPREQTARLRATSMFLKTVLLPAWLIYSLGPKYLIEIAPDRKVS